MKRGLKFTKIKLRKDLCGFGNFEKLRDLFNFPYLNFKRARRIEERLIQY